MTIEEAIKILKKEYLGDSEEMELAKYMGWNALENQIPKKPKAIDWEQYKDKVINAKFMRGGFWCPNCGHFIKSGSYCCDCGQALDWEGEE